MAFATRERLLPAIVIMVLPFVILAVLTACCRRGAGESQVKASAVRRL